MDIWQALAVALGLVLLVHGGLYISARSFSERPDNAQPIWWRPVRAGLRIGTVIFLLYSGTFVLTNGAPNFVSGGVAIFSYGQAIIVSGHKMFETSIFRIRALVSALMFSLFAVGAAIEGGPIGLGGAILSVVVATFWWWLALKIPWSET